MKNQNFSRILLILLFVAAVCVSAASQTPQMNQPMPVDPAITMGKFPNGLRYYILANKKPEKRAELRLVVKAGSVLEDDDQRGLAHFVEHMAFNGTKNFPKHGHAVRGGLECLHDLRRNRLHASSAD
jgi:zinc protease